MRKFGFLNFTCFVEDLKEKPAAWSFGWKDDKGVLRVKGVADSSAEAARRVKRRITDDWMAAESRELRGA
jgi:hypothetical protein